MMKKFDLHLLLLFITLFIACSSDKKNIPDYLMGEFQDDYNIEYELSEDAFVLKPKTRFHILTWNIKEQYFIAKNDSSNAYDANLYSRIDWMKFNEMEPFVWGFCLSAYNASSIDSAKAVVIADRASVMSMFRCRKTPVRF